MFAQRKKRHLFASSISSLPVWLEAATLVQTQAAHRKRITSELPDMGRTEADEVAELKQMFRSPARRPAWDSTPLRNRPAALIGLKPVTREPWCA